MMTFSIAITTMACISVKAFSSVGDLITAMPKPIRNERTSAVITSISGGICSVKKG